MAQGEEIFDNTKVTELALKWKALTADGRHGEAMPILEQIIKMCEQMFLSLAQYEGFTNTVDLPTLVQSAREKVPRWLLGWDPNYKSNNGLFSWISKCLSSDTRIFLADGSLRRIDEIVDNQQSVDVLVRDPQTGKLGVGRVTGWHRKLSNPDEWRKLSIAFRDSKKRTWRCLYVTHEHPLWHAGRREMVPAEDLKPGDPVLIKGVDITEYGKGALVGMVLGDATVDRKKGAVRVGHGGSQLWYAHKVARMFRADSHNYKTSNQTKKPLKCTMFCVSTMQLWPEANANLHRGVKRLNQWLLDKVTDVSLAFWFMDDGSVKVKSAVEGRYLRPALHTESFTRLECQQLQDMLHYKFGLLTTWEPRKGKDYGFLVFDGKDNADKFYKLIAPWMFKGFQYKLPSYIKAGDHELPAVEDALVETTVLINRPVKGNCNIAKRGQSDWYTPDFSKKYDITVDGYGNFLAEGVVVSNCAKHAFLSEIAKLNQHRNRYHATGDNLEKFFGAEDHAAFKDDAALEVKKKLADVAVRWGDPQEIGAVRYILECLVEDRKTDEKLDKERIIRSAVYAWCVLPDLARFFYDWALFALRDALYEKIRVPFTQQDILRGRESYTFLVDVIDIVGWDKFKKLVVTMGGQRIRIPTIQQLARQHEDWLMSQEIDKSDLDPNSIEKIGKKYGRSAKTAGEIYEDMLRTSNPNRSGEHMLYDDHSTSFAADHD